MQLFNLKRQIGIAVGGASRIGTMRARLAAAHPCNLLRDGCRSARGTDMRMDIKYVTLAKAGVQKNPLVASGFRPSPE